MSLPALLRGFFWAGVAILSLALWSSWLTGAPARADGAQNLQMALNLAHHGVFSTDSSGRPDMFREPLPGVVGAATVKAVDAVHGPAASDGDWFSGGRARALKHQNLLWLALLTFAAAASARTLGATRGGAVLAALLVNLVAYALRREFVDSLGTDLAGAALLMAGAGLTARGWISGRWRWWLAAGLVFGLAILVKASLMGVTIGLGAALALLAAWRNRGWPGDRVGTGVVAMLLAAAAVITPWTDRNARLFGRLAVSDRGGEVLLLRAYENMVTPTEYAGVWCAFAPGRMRDAVCRFGGWTRADLRPGGVLGRFSRSAPTDEVALKAAARRGWGTPPGLSFYQAAKARFRFYAEVRGPRDDALSHADRLVWREARSMILSNPLKHLAMTPAYLWRGLGGLTVWLGLAGLVAFLRRRDDLVVFLLPAVGLGGFMALFTHFIPRYAWPMIPFACVMLVLILEAALRRARG